MKYNNEELKELQKVEIEILKEVIRVCDENRIAWFTVGGTTLGAVRHNGFIPWDDDIDIGMLRNDYEKFLKLAPYKLGDKYILQHFSIDSMCPTYFAKVRKKNTVFLEPHMKNLRTNKGIFIDIFPFDFIPDEVKERELYFNKGRCLLNLYVSKIIRTATYTRNNYTKFLKDIFRSLLYLLLIPISRNKLFRILDRHFRKYNDCCKNRICTYGCLESDTEICNIFPTKKHIFEDIVVNIPNDYDCVLKKQYGEYMKMPPLDKRFTHKPIMIDFGN